MTDGDAQTDMILDRFFDTEFGQAAAALRRLGVTLLDAAPDPGRPTYYARRPHAVITKDDFELKLGDADAVRQLLGRVWTGAEATVLAVLADRVLALAPRFAAIEETDEVSPLIYVMF